MEVIIFISVAVMLCMLYRGLYLALEWNAEDRITGICTTVWVVVAMYLFVFQWLFVPRHEVIALAAITFLSTAGYVVGRTVTALTHREWIEE